MQERFGALEKLASHHGGLSPHPPSFNKPDSILLLQSLDTPCECWLRQVEFVCGFLKVARLAELYEVAYLPDVKHW
jgi:hypothetical protein